MNNFTPPCYLFQKLGRYFAVSTVSGDFYDISEQTYTALRKWNEQLSCLAKPEEAIADKLAQAENIPDDIIKAFPLVKPESLVKLSNAEKYNISDLTLNLTSSCNLACIYCWNDQGKYSDNSFASAQTPIPAHQQNVEKMSIKTAQAAVDMFVQQRDPGTKNLLIDFYGGEPLLNLETMRFVISYVQKNEAKWGVRIRFLLATNATLLTPSIAEELLNNGVQIAVSLDGPKEVQDKNRPFSDGTGSFDTIYANLKSMAPETLKRLVGRATVTPAYCDMVNLYKSLKAVGFERIELFESEDACHRINPTRQTMFFNTPEQYAELCREYERLALLYIEEVENGFLDYRKTFFNRFFKLMQRLYYQQEVSGGCPAGRGQIAVSLDGKIFPCTAFIGVDKFEIGSVDQGINQDKYKAFIKKADKRIEHCQECKLFSLCRATGSCLNLNHYYCGDMCKPYEIGCKFFTFKIELAIAALSILSDKIPDSLEDLFGNDPVGERGNVYY
ncbi:MAG: radical SAM protein [Candidatus Omnitrophota bacterium]